MTDIFELSPPVLFTLFLNTVGYVVGRTPFNRSYIPILLPVVGAIAYPFVAEAGKVSYTCAYPMALNALYGFLLGSASVGVDQVFKQLHRAKATKDTKLISKDNNAPEIVIPQPDKIIQIDNLPAK